MSAIGKDVSTIALDMSLSIQKQYSLNDFKWHYEHGLLLQSIYAVAQVYNNADLTQWVLDMYDQFITPDGEILTYHKQDYNLDQINPGKFLFDALEITKNQKYKKALDTLRSQLDDQPRTQSGGFWHKKIYPWQMWLDGIYMANPFYARYIANFETYSKSSDVVQQFELIYTHTRDEQSGLLHHAWDESCKQLWADRETGRSPHVWGRGMGWYCMALVDVLDWMPETAHKARMQLITIANSVVKPLLDAQDSDTGLWYQIMDMGSKAGNYLETSSTAMVVFFLYKMVRKHYLVCDDLLKEELVISAADKGFEGLCSRLSKDNDGLFHLSGTCHGAGLGGTPYRDGTFQYYATATQRLDDFKGIGSFILAAIESKLRKESK